MGSVFSTTTLKALPPLKDLLVPTPEAYVFIVDVFQYFPVVSVIQWLTSFHPAGKTSMNKSYLNIPGRLGWFIMEIVGPANLIYLLWKLPQGAPGVEGSSTFSSLPIQNKLVASLYVLHYINRAIISPFFSAPSMSPMHTLVVSMAVLFNWLNSSSLAGWLTGYEITTIPIFSPPSATLGGAGGAGGSNDFCNTMYASLGLGLFFIGMVGNIYSERTLFRLRREEAEKRSMKKSDTPTMQDTTRNDNGDDNKYSKVYVIPPAQGVFRTILYPHYVFEWIEWFGFMLVGTSILPFTPPSSSSRGIATTNTQLRLAPWLIPAVTLAEKLHFHVLPLPPLLFAVNAVANMLPHARWGRKWYLKKFGEEGVKGRGAVVPFCPWM